MASVPLSFPVFFDSAQDDFDAMTPTTSKRAHIDGLHDDPTPLVSKAVAESQPVAVRPNREATDATQLWTSSPRSMGQGNPNWASRLLMASLTGLLMIGAVLFCRNAPSMHNSVASTASAASSTPFGMPNPTRVDGILRWRQFDGQSNCLAFRLRYCRLVIQVPVPLLFCPFRATSE
jgi:hypothetical protein